MRIALTIIGLMLVGPRIGAEPATQDSTLFRNAVEPLLKQHCYKCHSHEAEEIKGGLVLDSPKGWMEGGKTGPAIVPGKPEESLLYQAVTHTHKDKDLRMPPKRKLPDADIAIIRDWIARGAFDPRGNVAASDTARYAEARKHWAFQSVKRPEVPAVNAIQPFLAGATKGCAAANPIDAFILHGLCEKGMSLNPEADRRTLVRRLYFDVVGLPPSPEEVEAFVSDRDPCAWPKLVDRLLASPHYGERWGRHWLDVAGFADSSLFIGDIIRPDFWRYRDYVIDALNKDKPYDEFVREQLAGDELTNWRAEDRFTPEVIEKLVATGFLRCPPDATDNQAITQMDKRFATQQNAMEVSMKALMGLSIQCVRCHSHKYDPIPQEDYYKLIAIFQPAYDPERWLAGVYDPKLSVGPMRAIPLLDRAGRARHEQKLEALNEERSRLRLEERGGAFARWQVRYFKDHLTEIPDVATRSRVAFVLQKEEAARTEEDGKLLAELAQRMGVTESSLRKMYPGFAREIEGLKARQNEITEEGGQLPPLIWALWDLSTEPSPARRLLRGNYENPAEEVPPGVISALETPENSFHLAAAPPFSHTTGRRLALANWLTHPSHPLTARVMVNRIWQYHFGSGLVATPDDFGVRGARPTHPALLDWLASEFVKSGWSIKQMHRLILLSSTWRQSSESDPVKLAADPENKLWGIYPRRRLEAEPIRDAMLAVSGSLDVRVFGKPVATASQPDGQWEVPPENPGRFRRAIYLSTKRTQLPNFLAVFDAPIMDSNWPKRSASAVAQQALAMMNSPIVTECAERFAERVMHSATGTEERLKFAVALSYGRPLDNEEKEWFLQFLDRGQKDGGAATGRVAWRLLCQALFSSNEFIYQD
jgi:hypothetical protein